MIPYKQLTLAEVFEDCQNKFDNDKYQFLSLLDQTINLDEIVPVSFVTHFHASTGRPRKHPLYPMIKALLIFSLIKFFCLNKKFFIQLFSRTESSLCQDRDNYFPKKIKKSLCLPETLSLYIPLFFKYLSHKNTPSFYTWGKINLYSFFLSQLTNFF